MLGSTPLSALLGAGLDNTDHDAVRAFINEAGKAGLSLLFIVPGTKVPADPRTPTRRRNDDKAARQAAKDAGQRDWERVKSPAGLKLATSDPRLLKAYFDHYVKLYGDDCAVNLAVEVGGSRLVVVDCDTAEQLRAFLDATEAPDDLPPTVVTPGSLNENGEWVHSDGGHFYFTLDEDDALPTNAGALTYGSGDAAFAVLWDSRYVLIPPSTRPEGAYELVGRDYPLPDSLREIITERSDLRAERSERVRTEADDELSAEIDAWSEGVSWARILEPLGWSMTARPDTCGCPVWTAPGVHASPKSATAHDSGCSLGRYTETNAPLHIWTDHPGEPFEEWVGEHGSSTISKLQAIAASEYAGKLSDAMEELGLTPEPVSLGHDKDLGAGHADTADDEVGVSSGNLSEEMATEPETDESDAPNEEPTGGDYDPSDMSLSGPEPAERDDSPFSDDVDIDDGVFRSEVEGVPTIAPFAHWRDIPPPEYIVAGLIEAGGLCSLIGPPGAGKSAVALDMACSIATGQRWQGREVMTSKVLYLPGEGLSGAVQRILAWEDAHGAQVGDNLLMGDDIVRLGAKVEAWKEVSTYALQQGVGMIVFDTFARMATGIEENSATEVGRAVSRLDQMRKLTGAGVLIVHHTAKGSDSGRGSSALNGALDSELLLKKGEWRFEDHNVDVDPDDATTWPQGKRIELSTSKQKNTAELDEPMPLMLVPHELSETDSVIITGPHGRIVDPFDPDVAIVRSVTPEPLVEIAIRILSFVEQRPQQGATRAEIAEAVAPDTYTARRPDAPKRWKRRVADAVDKALRYQLIETLTGTASGQRYIPSIGTPASARQQAADEQMSADND